MKRHVSMETPARLSPASADNTTGIFPRAIPFILGGTSLFIGLFFMRPNMGEPDSYREALSALQYIETHTYGSYWDHPLTMYMFVVATRLAHALGLSQIAAVNTLAVLLGAVSIWPLYHFIRKLVNWQTAAFVAAALILSPSFIRFTTYLSHEIAGFAFTSWSLYLVQRTLEERSRKWALTFGFCFAAAWAARPNGVMFLFVPLLILSVYEFGWKGLTPATRLLSFALLGFFGCSLLIYRPALIMHLTSTSGRFLFTYYEFARYIRSTTEIALESLTPVLVGLSAAGCIALLIRRRYLIASFAGIWMLVAYAFYTGMYSMHRYFIVSLPPSLLLCFAGADMFDGSRGRWAGHPAKTAVLLLLLLASLGPNLPDLIYLRKENDDKLASETIGKLVGRNLLFTTADEPMIRYYNREHPPETVYLVTEYTPGRLGMQMDALRLAQKRLQMRLPVFATDEIIDQFRFVGIQTEYELIWEYKRMRLYRLTSLRLTEKSPSRFSGQHTRQNPPCPPLQRGERIVT